MNKCACFFTSTLGKKVTMAVTGLLLIGFLVVHLIGNLTLFPAFGGQEKFNAYAHLLSSTPVPKLCCWRSSLFTWSPQSRCR
jgi:succinate dehydrogenase / fumarate reductase, cytochrome b subunit